MNLQDLKVHLQHKVLRYCFLSDTDYTLKLLKLEIARLGYKLVEIQDPGELKPLVGRSPLFNKVCYISKYDAAIWNYLGKNPLANPVILLAQDSRCKAAEELTGIPEPELLQQYYAKLRELGCVITTDGWNALVNHHRSKDGKLEDPEALFNQAYSLGLQAEQVDGKLVQQHIGFKAEIWDLFNSLLAKNKVSSLRAMYLLVNDGEAVSLVMGLQKMLCDLLNVKDAMATMTSDGYASQANMHPYRAKMLYQQAKCLTIPRSALLLEMLLRLDMDLKRTSCYTKTEIFKNAIMHYVEQKD